MAFLNRKTRVFNQCIQEPSPYMPCANIYDYGDPWDKCISPENRIPIVDYVSAKRIVQEYEIPKVKKKHSDGRMKTYPSATNVSWSLINEERRQHILQLVRQDFGITLSIGKYIPLELIIEFLIANSNAIIKQLQNELRNVQNQLAKYKGNNEKESSQMKVKGTSELGTIKDERDCLKQQVEDLLKMQKDYEKLLEDSRVKIPYKTCVDLLTYKSLEEKYNQTKIQADRVEQIEREKCLLIQKLEEYESTIKNQEIEITRLSCYIRCLNQDWNMPGICRQQSQKLPMVCHSGEGQQQQLTETCSGCGVCQLPQSVAVTVCPIQKVAEVENFLRQLNQNEINEQVHSLVTNVDRLTKELQLEKQKNFALIRRYTNQCDLVTNMKSQIYEVKRKSHRDRRKLHQLNVTLKEILESSSGSIRSCICLEVIHPKPASPHTISHFRAEPSLEKIEENEFKYNGIVKKCSTSSSESSADSYAMQE